MKRRRKGGHGHVSHERWLISYADFITLLFAFFVVLYAASRRDQTKAREMAQSIQQAFVHLGLFQTATPAPVLQASGPAPRKPDAAVEADRLALVALERQLNSTLAPEIARGSVSVNLSRQGLLIRVQQLGFFASGSDQLNAASLPILARIGEAVAKLPNPIRVEGYTDDVPIHTVQFSSNWQLSTARAATLVRLLIDDYHLAPARLSAAGYGQYHPIASNATPQGRERNRRVDVVVESLVTARATAPAGSWGNVGANINTQVVDPATAAAPPAPATPGTPGAPGP